jgi:hypothetical protein
MVMPKFGSEGREVFLFVCFIWFFCHPVTVFASSMGPQIFDLTYKPSPFHVGTGIEVVPRLLGGTGEDVRFHCRWFVNGREIEGQNGPSLSGDFFMRGDMISVEVTAVQGEYRGGAVKSGEVEVANAPPEIVSQPPAQVVEGSFEYRLEAVDADGDDLTFSLAEAPESMQFDAETGRLLWHVEPWTKGDFSVSVVVQDEYGGLARQDFVLNLDHAEGKDAFHE